jgi:hypothetical protein
MKRAVLGAEMDGGEVVQVEEIEGTRKVGSGTGCPSA